MTIPSRAGFSALIRSLHAALLASVLLVLVPDPIVSAGEPPQFRPYPPTLYGVVRHGDMEKLVRVLDADPVLVTALLGQHDKGRHGREMTLLHEAALEGQLPPIEELLHRGADVNSHLAGNLQEGWLGATPLHGAAIRGRSHVIPVLLQNGAEINAKDSEGCTPLHRALLRNYRRAARILATRGAEQDIFAAAGLGNLTLLERFLAEDPGLANARTGGGETPLHFAACNGEIGAARVLMQRGAAIDAMANPVWGAAGETPLHEAAFLGHRALCEFLLDRGADLEAEGSNSTPLDRAIIRGHLAVVQLLIERGADVNHRDRNDLSTPLHTAARFGWVDIADLLLQHGGPINCPGGDYRDLWYKPPPRGTPPPTPLDRAVANKNRDMVRFLLLRGGRLGREHPKRLEEIFVDRRWIDAPWTVPLNAPSERGAN